MICSDAWIVSGLQYLESARAVPALTETLGDLADPEHDASGLRTRVLRAIAALGDGGAIPSLVNFLLSVESSIHKDLAAGCIAAFIRRHVTGAAVTHLGSLQREMQRLKNTLERTARVEVERPWYAPIGSPKWADAVKQTIAKLDRLEESLSVHTSSTGL